MNRSGKFISFELNVKDRLWLMIKGKIILHLGVAVAHTFFVYLQQVVNWIHGFNVMYARCYYVLC